MQAMALEALEWVSKIALADNQRVANLEVTPEYLIAAAARILRPCTFEVKEVARTL